MDTLPSNRKSARSEVDVLISLVGLTGSLPGAKIKPLKLPNTSVSSCEVSWNRILDANMDALCQCPPVVDKKGIHLRLR
jgi:hypothetical protein